MSERTVAAEGWRDFDFLHGRWCVHHRRLQQRLVGSQDWETFESVAACIPILDGLGNVEEIRTESGPLGTSLRFFDLAARRWQIWWVARRDGVMQPPVTGGFANGVGIFEGADTHDAKPIRVRFTWRASPSTPRWEQAFSADGGRTWETNWVMEFTRDGSTSPPLWPPTLQ
jgi:hypothetical protein